MTQAQRLIEPAGGPIDNVIRPPGSKSLTNRALIVAAMADGRSKLTGTLDSDDTQAMVDSLRRLGVDVEHVSGSDQMTIEGTGGRFHPRASLTIGNSGTSIRFLTAMLGMAGGQYRLDGVSRMRERPIGPLVDALRQLGVDIETESPRQCPPVVIKDSPRVAGGSVPLSGDLSSQYLSGLLMAAPMADGPIELVIEGELISKPYVEMTCCVMESFGVQVKRDWGSNRFFVAADQHYQARDYAIEPDASAASYFWATAAILGGTATVAGLNRDALQGDVGFVDCLVKMGCSAEYQDDSIAVTGPAKSGIKIDMSDVSDTVQTLAAVSLFVSGPTTVTNVAHNRVKETDRIGNLAIELRKFGAVVDEHADGLTIHPPGPNGFQEATIETYDDHRMAMSLSLVGLKQAGVEILDPGCVSKTYPNFFRDLDQFVGTNQG